MLILRDSQQPFRKLIEKGECQDHPGRCCKRKLGFQSLQFLSSEVELVQLVPPEYVLADSE